MTTEQTAERAAVAFRAATGDNCRSIAGLVRTASEGVSDYIWSTLAPQYPGLSRLEIGARRYRDEDTPFSYKNCVVAESGGIVIGLLLAFPTPESVEEDSEPGDPVLEPYRLELPGSWYICSLAVQPAFRGGGIGTKLLSVAREQARAARCGELSLLVFEQNRGAVRLYEREGFRVLGRTPVVPHELIQHTGSVLLMAAKVRAGVAERGRRYS